MRASCAGAVLYTFANPLRDPSSRLTVAGLRASERRPRIRGPPGAEKGTSMQIKQWTVWRLFVVAAVVLIGAVEQRRAADEWFVLGEQMLKSVDRGEEIKSEGDRWDEGRQAGEAERRRRGPGVEEGHPAMGQSQDDTITDIGVLKAGGSHRAADAPGRKGRLTAVTVQYEIVGRPGRPWSRSRGYD